MSDGSLFDSGGLFSTARSPYEHIIPPRSALDIDRMVGELAQMEGLSDIWLTEEQPPRVKRHNELSTLDHIGPQPAHLMHEWVKTMLQGEAWHQNTDAAHSIPTPVGIFRFRVNIYQQMGKMRLCMRLINTDIPHYRALGLPDSVMKSILTARDGLAFFVGSTGSGKSTSIASLLTERATAKAGHIITLEDPIEYRFKDMASFFSQRQKGQDFDTFADALKYALRQAPNDIMIGEIRDEETASIALHAAETGHFVLSTLHTKRAPEAINRFKLLFPEGQHKQICVLLSSLLRFVVCQRLIRNVDGKRMALFEVMHVSYESGTRPLIRADKIGNLFSAMESGGVEDNLTFERCLDEAFKAKLLTQRTYDETKEELSLERG